MVPAQGCSCWEKVATDLPSMKRTGSVPKQQFTKTGSRPDLAKPVACRPQLQRQKVDQQLPEAAVPEVEMV